MSELEAVAELSSSPLLQPNSNSVIAAVEESETRFETGISFTLFMIIFSEISQTSKFINLIYQTLRVYTLLYVSPIGNAVVYLSGSIAKVEVTLDIPATELTSFL